MATGHFDRAILRRTALFRYTRYETITSAKLRIQYVAWSVHPNTGHKHLNIMRSVEWQYSEVRVGVDLAVPTQRVPVFRSCITACVGDPPALEYGELAGTVQ